MRLARRAGALLLLCACNTEQPSARDAALSSSSDAADLSDRSGAAADEGAPNGGDVPGAAREQNTPSQLQPATPAADSAAATSAGDAGPPVPDAALVPLPEANLPLGVVSRFPSAGATGICRDVPLRLSFADDVRLGTAGRISIFASNAPTVAVASIDMAAQSFTDTIATRPTNLVRPVFLDGRDAVMYFRRNALAPDTSYFVRVDAGVFVAGSGPSSGAALATTSDASWTFRTGPAPAASAHLVVQRESAGDFCTLQSALDAVPVGNTAPVTIELRSGTYHEIGYLTGKSNVTLRGENRDTTIVSYPNNEDLNGGTVARAMLTALNSNGLVIENLTLHNTTPQGGSQAEVLRVRAEQVILRNSNFLSLQDTLLLEGRVYVADSYVEGNVDFVWGVGTAYFERSEIKIVGRSGVIVQARNGANAFGYVFVDSRLTSDPGLTNSTLARIDATVYPSSQVAYVNCQLGPQISAAGWTVTPTGTTATGALRFWEFQSTDLAGQALDVSRRHPASRQITPAEAAALRDKPAVLGGWDPTL